MSLLQAYSVEKVVHRPESETLPAKHLPELHDSLTPCLRECVKCYPSVALVGCCSCLLTGGFCDWLSVLSDLAEPRYPLVFCHVRLNTAVLALA